MCCIKEKVNTTYTYTKTNRDDNTTAPYKEPNQSTNSIKEVMLSPMYIKPIPSCTYNYNKVGYDVMVKPSVILRMIPE